MSRFMETQITVKRKWLLITEAFGESYYIDAEDAEAFPKDNVTIEEVIGYGVRESAPGYLDCTDWEVFPTIAEAEARAADIDKSYDDEMDDDRLKAGD